MEKVEAYKAFGIFGDYDGNAPDTSTVCLVATEDLAKEVCAKLNMAPESYNIICTDGFEWSKRFAYREELTENPNVVCKTFDDAMSEIAPDYEYTTDE